MSALQSAKPTIREARESDIPQILGLLDEFVKLQVILPRDPEEMRRNYPNFVVAFDEAGKLVGAGALRPHGEGLFEVRSLAVSLPCQGSGLGSLLVEALLERARAMTSPVRCVFTLTKRPHFFQQLGFQIAPKGDFPEKIWADCLACPKFNCCDEVALRIDGADLAVRNRVAGV